jgi:hypothetical protein
MWLNREYSGFGKVGLWKTRGLARGVPDQRQVYRVTEWNLELLS